MKKHNGYWTYEVAAIKGDKISLGGIQGDPKYHSERIVSLSLLEKDWWEQVEQLRLTACDCRLTRDASQVKYADRLTRMCDLMVSALERESKIVKLNQPQECNARGGA